MPLFTASQMDFWRNSISHSLRLNEQRRIVELLDRAAEIRRRADAARTKARALIPALFLDTFGDPATNPKAGRSARSQKSRILHPASRKVES